jgi:hypothetical protein
VAYVEFVGMQSCTVRMGISYKSATFPMGYFIPLLVLIIGLILCIGLDSIEIVVLADCASMSVPNVSTV